MLYRHYQDIEKLLEANKALILLGPRRVGKTTILTEFLKNTSLKYRLDNGDNLATRDILGSQRFDRIFRYAEGYELIAIDEAQRISNVGMGIKILVDQIPGIRVIATGSASFDLSHQVGEPLVGRKRTLTIYPLAQQELLHGASPHDLEQQKEDYLVFGSYPEVLTAKTEGEKRDILTDIAQSYLLKDILELDRVRGSATLVRLVQLLALQVGSEVSRLELASNLEIDVKTVTRYLDLLEKAFVIFEVRAYHRNLRKELMKKSKYFFYDTGIRNAVISNFNRMFVRDDVGRLWENFCIVERRKKQEYSRLYANNYFWRTWDQKEIDWVEMREGKLFGYEITWGTQKKMRSKNAWLAAYPNEAEFELINQENYLSFIT